MVHGTGAHVYEPVPYSTAQARPDFPPIDVEYMHITIVHVLVVEIVSLNGMMDTVINNADVRFNPAAYISSA
jgi:hypothetical protein